MVDLYLVDFIKIKNLSVIQDRFIYKNKKGRDITPDPNQL